MRRVSKSELVSEIDKRATGEKRVIVAIAGPPGSGKSTLAEDLAGLLDHSAEVLPMDGYHLENDQLADLGLIERKGAPETFDVSGFAALIARLRGQSEISYPTFDRERDKTVPDGGCIRASTRVVLVEGNYLLLDIEPWRELGPHFDMTVRLDVPMGELKERLLERWRKLGLSEQSAERRVLGNDLLNAEQVLKQSRKAEFSIASCLPKPS